MDYTRLIDAWNNCDYALTDSREVAKMALEGKKSIFFAIKGERFDANDFAMQALNDGAVYVVADSVEKVDGDNPRVILVPDTLDAMATLAAAYISQMKSKGLKVLAITGSNGKTTTKELVSRVFAVKYRVHTTQGNFNNHIGVPLTILRMPRNAEFAVIEMGANHCGEIALLCSIAQPDYGIITNIGRAHLEGFGGEDGIRRGKGELFDYLEANNGEAFYLIDSDALCEMTAARGGLATHPYSSRTSSCTVDGEGYSIVRYKSERHLIKSKLVGEYNKFNIVAAMTIAEYFGIDLFKAALAIEAYQPDNNRSQRVTGSRNNIIVDAYNANPSSMESSIKHFASMSDINKMAILGDMKELGEYSFAEHRQIVSLVESLNIDNVLFVGDEFTKAATGTDYNCFKSSHELINHLKSVSYSGFTILVKGSHSIGLEKIIPYL